MCRCSMLLFYLMAQLPLFINDGRVVFALCGNLAAQTTPLFKGDMHCRQNDFENLKLKRSIFNNGNFAIKMQ